MNNIFEIREIPKWQGLEWSVTWYRYGFVKKDNALFNIWDQAFKTGADIVGFANINEALSINAEVYYRYNDINDIAYMLKPVLPIASVAFPEREHAEKFVDGITKIIEWNILTKDYD